MADYIKREDAINIKRKYDGYMSRAVAYAFWRELASLNATQVRPVVRGQWEFECENLDEQLEYCCSVCDCVSDNKYNFCPNCGADMRAEEGEAT